MLKVKPLKAVNGKTHTVQVGLFKTPQPFGVNTGRIPPVMTADKKRDEDVNRGCLSYVRSSSVLQGMTSVLKPSPIML